MKIKNWDQDDELTWMNESGQREYMLTASKFRNGYSLTIGYTDDKSQSTHQRIIAVKPTKTGIKEAAYRYMKRHPNG